MSCAILLVASRANADLTPYSGTAVSIPGVVQAANFDGGGESIAYHDTTPGNSGGAYRNTDVDLEPSSEGGYDVGWIAAGEWLNYTVSVANAGSYTVNLRVASPYGASMHVGFNTASNVWNVVSVPNTGGWQNWTTVTTVVSLGAGQQQLTLLFDTGGMNVASIGIAGATSVLPPLTLTSVPNQTATSSNGGPVAVTFPIPNASGGTPPYSAVTCSPASGALFPIGTTTTTCSVTDSAAPPAIARSVFSVTVVAASGSLTVAWDGNPESDHVTDYQVLYGTTGGQYTAAIDTGLATTATLSGLAKGVTYYIVVRAFNGIWSGVSDQVNGTP